jgi:hypothetical protein
MGRRISDSDPSGKKPCAFCRTMRVVVIFAVMVVMLMAYANKLHWLKDVDFTSLFGYLVVVFFCTVLGYRVWDEYGRPQQSQAELDAKRAQREKQFDEIDALEAKRAMAELSAVTAIKVVGAETTEAEIAEVEVPHVKEIELDSTQADSTQADSTEVNSTEVNSTEVNSTEVNSAEVNSAEVKVTELLNPQVKPESDASSDPEQLDLLGFSTRNKADK